MVIDMEFPVETKEQILQEKFEVIEWRDGKVYKTKSVGLFWTDVGVVASPDKKYIYVALSTSLSKRLSYDMQFRKVPVSTPVTERWNS